MAEPNESDEAQKSTAEKVAQSVFSSEKREDIWALLIAGALFLISVIAPNQVQAFFSNALILF